jgi:hypothetical protein
MNWTDHQRLHDEFMDSCSRIKTLDQALTMLSAIAAQCASIKDPDAPLVFNFTWDAIEKVQALRQRPHP